jgi:hypothetical protein
MRSWVCNDFHLRGVKLGDVITDRVLVEPTFPIDKAMTLDSAVKILM